MANWRSSSTVWSSLKYDLIPLAMKSLLSSEMDGSNFTKILYFGTPFVKLY